MLGKIDDQSLAFRKLLYKIQMMHASGNLVINPDESIDDEVSGYKRELYETLEFAEQPQTYRVQYFQGEPVQINANVEGQVTVVLYA